MPFMNILRSKSLTAIISMMVALQLMNMSIDAVDAIPHGEDLTINEIESCVELVVEVFMGHHNAIQENDDDDGNVTKPLARIVLYSSQSIGLIQLLDYPTEIQKTESPYFMNFKSVSLSIVSPPPKDA
jgi:hypothetical protein